MGGVLPFYFKASLFKNKKLRKPFPNIVVLYSNLTAMDVLIYVSEYYADILL